MLTPRRAAWPLALALLTACAGEEEPPTAPGPTPPPVEALALAPEGPQTVGVGQYTDYTITGLDVDQAYRITLVEASYITAAGDGTASFVANDAGTANAGRSELVGLITYVNGLVLNTPARTVPAGTDNPASPTGVYDYNGEITFRVEGVGGGTVYPVIYHNGGSSTFLELSGGAPTEVYLVGGGVTVPGPARPVITPYVPTTVPVDGVVTYTASGLSDAQAYRITLVAGGYVSATGADGVFTDDDANGVAEAGPSENYALITSVNGSPVDPVKTVPAGTDDPAAPTGVYPTGGQITFEITGVAAGTVYPVVYHNGGASTFLELGGNLEPTEVYAVGGSLAVGP